MISYFNFYGIEVKLICDQVELSKKLHKDFSFFKARSGEESSKKIVISAQAKKIEEYPFSPNIIRFQNSKVRIYEKDKVRICSYSSSETPNKDEISISNFKKNKIEIFCTDLNRLHELTYLAILSRVGKALDEIGLHRLHAMAAIKNETLYLGLMSSGVGKTTLLTHLLSEAEFSLVSDDSPLIDRKGRVYPFPIRVGFEAEGIIPPSWNEAPFYTLNRKEYGLKKLVSIEDIKSPIGGEYNRIKLFKGERGFENAKLKPVSFLKVFKHIFEQGIIGVGLPILFEYFWEFGPIDFLRKIKIFFSRSLSFYCLVKRSEVYEFQMSSEISENIKEMNRN